MSNRSSNGKKAIREEKPRRTWQQYVFIGISVILIIVWILSLVLSL